MAKVEGKGNGIKTVIVNMVDVAKAIGRPATCKFYFIYFFLKYQYIVQLLQNLSVLFDRAK